MKKNYPALTFLTGVLLVGGILFARLYNGSANTTAAEGAIAQNQPVSTETNVTSGDSQNSTNTAAATTNNTQTSESATKSTSGAASNSSGFTNGTYKASAQYETPDSQEGIDVSLTVSNGIVTDASISNSGYSRTSSRYQGMFASSYRSYVIGKRLSSLQLNRVAGASLTTGAFNEAIAQIRNEAAA